MIRISILFSVCFLISINSQAQIQYDTTTYTLSFKKIEQVDLSKELLKSKIEKWFAVTFKDSKEVIRLSNDETIIGKGYIKGIINSGKYTVETIYNLTIDVAIKDGRYKLEMYDLTSPSPVGNGEIPLFYSPNLNLENYEEFSLKMLQYIDNPQIKKDVVKFIEKGKIRQDDIDKSNDLNKQVYTIIDKNFNSLATDLKTFLKSESKKDDW